jgi:hypothetical protein
MRGGVSARVRGYDRAAQDLVRLVLYLAILMFWQGTVCVVFILHVVGTSCVRETTEEHDQRTGEVYFSL